MAGLLRKLKKLNVGVVPSKEETLYSNLCKLKQKGDMEDRKDLVYLVPCGACRVRYVGETGQHYCDRKSQHQCEVKNKKTMNAFDSHIKGNKGHRIEWEDCVYLDKEKN